MHRDASWRTESVRRFRVKIHKGSFLMRRTPCKHGVAECHYWLECEKLHSFYRGVAHVRDTSQRRYGSRGVHGFVTLTSPQSEIGRHRCDRSGARGWNCLGGFSHIWQSIGGCDHGGIWRFVLYCSRCHLERWNDGSRDDLASGNRCCFGQRLPPANDGRAARDVDPTGEPKCQRKLLEF